MTTSLHAQSGAGPTTAATSATTLPYPSIRQPDPERYNLKWRNLIARFNASFSVEATDNINLSENDPEADLGFGPNIGAGFLWPISEANLLQVDMGFGYRWYVEHPSIQSLSVAPDSHVDYQVYFDHGRLSFHNGVAVEVDPTARPDVSGSSGEDVTNFRRVNNTTGLTGEWQPVEDFSFSAGYEFTLDRSLTGEFANIDRDAHGLSLGAFWAASKRMTLGLSGSYTFSSYVQDFHNNSHGYALGPVVIWKLSQFVSAEASASYSVADFDSVGSINDTTDFQGITAQLTLKHTINSRMAHEVTVEQGYQVALESNFYETTSVRYGMNARVHSKVSLHGRAHYEHFSTSGAPHETADRFSFYIGAGYQLARRWQLSTGYTFMGKESNLSGNDYLQNRVTVEVTRQF